MSEGTWPQDCIQRAFVEGAKWWQFHHNGSTMFGSERDEAEAEAVKLYGEPKKKSCITVLFPHAGKFVVEVFGPESRWVRATMQEITGEENGQE